MFEKRDMQALSIKENGSLSERYAEIGGYANRFKGRTSKRKDIRGKVRDFI